MTSRLTSPLNVIVSLDNLLHSFRRDGNGKHCLIKMASDPLFDQLAKKTLEENLLLRTLEKENHQGIKETIEKSPIFISLTTFSLSIQYGCDNLALC